MIFYDILAGKKIVSKSDKELISSTILERPICDVLLCDRERVRERKIEREQRV